LLGKLGYNGVKTGITEAAGPCLSVSYQLDSYHFILVLLNCYSTEARWEEAPLIIEWGKSYLLEQRY